MFGLAAHGQGLERPREQPAGEAAGARLVFLLPALALAGLAFPGFSGNRFRLLPTVAWLVSLALLYLAFCDELPRRVPRGERVLAGGLHISWHALALIGIILIGALLRFWQLDAIPREMGVDMPLKYQNALEIMQGQFMIFCPRYPGREALFFYLIAAYGKLFSLGFFAIKFTCAALGLATIPAVYGVARYLFDRNVGLVAAAFLAVSKWHVILSRTGYRLIMVPLFVAGLIFLVVRALRRGRSADFVLAGMLLGLGMYTYNAFLIVPPTLAVALAIELALRGRQSLRRYGWGFLSLALGALLVFLPLGRYALESPESYIFRVATRMTGIEAPLPHDLVRTFADNLWRAAGMFNLQGDSVFYVNVPFQRELGIISGVLFVFGLAYLLGRWRHGQNAMILVFLAGMILPTALSLAFPQEVPSASRVSGILTPVYLLVALPLSLVGRRLAGLWRGGIGRRWPGLLVPTGWLALAILVGVEFRETWRTYFQDYVAHLPQHNYAITLELARTLDDYGTQGQSFIKYVPYWYDGNALRAQLHVLPQTWNGELTEMDPTKPPLSTVRGPVMFILHPDDRPALELLRSIYPCGIAVKHWDYDGQVAFITFYGER